MTFYEDSLLLSFYNFLNLFFDMHYAGMQGEPFLQKCGNCLANLRMGPGDFLATFAQNGIG